MVVSTPHPFTGSERKIVVVGGGIGGLTFASAAKRVGFKVVVVERSFTADDPNAPSALGGGIGLWPPSQEVLHSIGALAPLLPGGAYMPSPCYLNSGGAVLGRPSAAFQERFPVLCLQRSELAAQLLRGCLELGVEFLSGLSVVDLSVPDNDDEMDEDTKKLWSLNPDARRVSILLSDGCRVHADLIIGADGIHSLIRSKMLSILGRPPKEPESCGYAYFRACLKTDRLPNPASYHEVAFESWGRGCRFGYVPLKKPETFWFIAVPITRAATSEDDESIEGGLAPVRGSRKCNDTIKHWLLSLIKTWKAPIDLEAMVEASDGSSILRTDIQKVSATTNFPWAVPDGRIILLGDSAHATSPNLAQGAGLAIEDAAELASLLAAACQCKDWSKALQFAAAEYQRKRKPRAATVQSLADTVARIGQLSGPAALARDCFMRFMTSAFPRLQQKIFELVTAWSLGGHPFRNTLHWELPSITGAAALHESNCLMARAMGKNLFSQLPAQMRRFRASPTGGSGLGEISVRRGFWCLGGLLGPLLGLPPNMSKEPFQAIVEPIEGSHGLEQRWTRVFAYGSSKAVAIASTHRATPHLTACARKLSLPWSVAPRGMVLTESLGFWPDLLRFGYSIEVLKNPLRVSYRSIGLWFCRFQLPIPSFLLPSSSWTETPNQEGWEFEGVISLPPILCNLPVMKYWGNFRADIPPGVKASLLPACPGSGSSPNGRAIVSGGTGLIGRAVCKEFARQGYEVIVLTRNMKAHTLPPGAACFWEWDGESGGSWQRLIDESTVLVNLAGENPGAKRWTAEFKKAIQASRLKAIEGFGEAIQQATEDGRGPKCWVQASAVGVYGSRGSEVLDDYATAPQDDCFRSDCCKHLEGLAARTARESGKIPLIIARIGHVLSASGGLLPHLDLASMFGASRLGDGQQYVPWIHIEDAAAALVFSATSKALFNQTFNLVAPNPATNAELLQYLATLQRRHFCCLAVPQKPLKIAFGESATVIFDSQRCHPSWLLSLGFKFRHEHLLSALASAECLLGEVAWQ